MHISILYLNLQIKNFPRSLFFLYSYQKYIKKPRQNCRHHYCCFYSYIYIHNFQCFCSPDMMPAYLSEKELDRVEEKWNSEQVDKRNKRRNRTTHHTHTSISKYKQRKEKKKEFKNPKHHIHPWEKLLLMSSSAVIIVIFIP